MTTAALPPPHDALAPHRPGRRARRRWSAWAPLALIALVGLAPAPAAADPAPAGEARATAEGCYVGVNHMIFLDRPATDAELADWQGRFDAGTPLYRLPQALANGDEWLTVVVTGLYQQALDRNPDASGLAYWIDRLRGGALVNDIAADIYGSPEFYDDAGGTDAAFVTDLYHRILGRSPDASGQAYWEDEVARRGRGNVAAEFFASVESRGDRVDGLYQQILGRPADAPGRAYWVDRLLRDNDVRLAVLLASSDELAERASDVCTHTFRITRGDDHSTWPAISGDGRWVAFVSDAENLVPGDGNGERDLFLHDRTTGSTTRLTDGTDVYQLGFSADGRHLTFSSWEDDLVPGDVNETSDVFTWDRTTGVTTRITDGDGPSSTSTISADGRHIAFTSNATDLVAGDTNGETDVFTWDRTTGNIVRITAGDSDSHQPSISADGRHIAFGSSATDIVAGDTNGETDVFTWDRTTGDIIAIASGDAGSQQARISADGRHVAFTSEASDLVPGDTNGQTDVFTWDRTTGETLRITDGDSGSRDSTISADGSRIAFGSQASDLVPGDQEDTSDVFLWERSTGTTTRITDTVRDGTTSGYAGEPALSADGRHVVHRAGVGLIPRAETSYGDIYVWSSLA